MHIGLNLLYLVPGETGGMETYARELIPELVAAGSGHRFTAFVSREGAAAVDQPWITATESVEVPVLARSRLQRVRAEQQLLPPLADRLGVEVLHSLASTAPAWGASRRVTTIHDLNYRIVPQAHSRLLGVGMRVLVPLAARRSHRIIVSAQSAREDLRRLLHVPEARIDVVPLGVGARRTPPIDPDELRVQLEAGERAIVLSTSAKLPHKNLDRLIRAMARISRERRPLLVLTGYRTAHERELEQLIVSLGLQPDVRLLGWVDPATLEGLYAAASCFVFPSLYEGFGLPVLEAMARGVPVATSGRGALAEVAGGAALLFDPESEAAIAAAVVRVLNDPGEAAALREQGLRQAARFSWAAAAAGTLAAYERAC